MKYKKILGIDIGGSGIKGAPVNAKDGLMLASRHRIHTPSPATPENVAPLIRKMSKHFRWKGPVGCGFPGVIQNGIARTAANLDDAWKKINTEMEKAGRPRGINFISGPSSTGDIDAQLVMGAHGPRAWHVILMGEVPESALENAQGFMEQQLAKL